jgi:hypothetical protein
LVGFTAISASRKIPNPIFQGSCCLLLLLSLLLRKDRKFALHVGERDMKNYARTFLFPALLLVLLTTACGAGQGETPTTIVGTPLGPTETIGTTPTATGSGIITPAETITTGLETATVSAGNAGTLIAGTQAPSLGTTQMPGIPVTGQDIMLVECQFCVDTRAYALLVLPDTATFNITSPVPSTTTTTADQPTCTAVEVNNGRQVVLCSGPEMTPLVVNICTDASNCTDFPVDLLACPLTQGSAGGPANTQQAPGTGGTGATATTSPGAVATSTATPAGPTATATP